METALRYASRGGNTKKLADAIAKAVNTTAVPVGQPLAEPVDLLFLGGSVYGGGIDASLRGFIETLTPQQVGRVAVFSTAAIKTSAYPEIKRLVEARGIPVSEKEFHCRGQFTLLHRGRPNAQDLADAARFAQEAAQ